MAEALHRGRQDLPLDFDKRIRSLRERLGMTQESLADKLGVSFASVNRWENRKAKPSMLAWERLLQVELHGVEALEQAFQPPAPATALPPPAVRDFGGRPEVVRIVVEGERLTYGHLANPVFAIESSLVEPLPHQRIAVYDHMLPQSRLRFLLADDAGAGKTIMTGLYIREMRARRLISRVLIVPPAGLVGNWQQEMGHLFGLPFRVVAGSEARFGNPFAGPESDLLIVSLDTLDGERMFARLQEPEVKPYDLVVFDEAHKLSADREADLSIRKTDRYELAEAVAGVWSEEDRWRLGWACQHLLLLTATPHMGKYYPYYALWRLLEPDVLSSPEAFHTYPPDARRRHFIRRTKEEMVHYNGRLIYPTRISDTLSYELTQGAMSEQTLYDQTTHYLQTYYNRAELLNRSAVRLAMSVFQRRLASSTYALLRSFERRLSKLNALIARVQSEPGALKQFPYIPREVDRVRKSLYEKTADEEQAVDGREETEIAEEQALEAVTARSLEDLQEESLQVEALLRLARQIYDLGEESKFEKLWKDVLSNPDFKRQKLILFTEHRDTLEFLVNRLDAMGFAGQVALIHGGMDYLERQRQVEFFRRDAEDGGATYLVATDAAGEGINLQFCWLMVNYDIPWNPARLEQRMGRIHRYGQPRPQVISVNLVAGRTREGRVLKTLLEKLEQVRRDMGSDKVFNVVGRIFEGIPLRQYLEQAITEAGATQAAQDVEEAASEEHVRQIEEKEQEVYHQGQGEVSRELPQLRARMECEVYRRLLPGYVRRYMEKAAPLLGIELAGDLDSLFSLRAREPRALDPFWPVMEAYPAAVRERLTFYSPWLSRSQHSDSLARDSAPERSIFIHPGEPFFDRFHARVQDYFREEALRGAVFLDPKAERPYLVHVAQVTVRRQTDPALHGLEQDQILERRLVGLRQDDAGVVQQCPVECLLLLQDGSSIPPGVRQLVEMVGQEDGPSTFELERMARVWAEEHRQQLLDSLPERIGLLRRGYDYQEADLAERRSKLRQKADNPLVKREIEAIRRRQAQIEGRRQEAIAVLEREPQLIAPGEIIFLAHALVLPSDDPEDRQRFDERIEEIAVRAVIAYEESLGGIVQDVSSPDRAGDAGLPDWPGFDLLSTRSDGRKLAIEVKGRAGGGSIELTENEWARACNLGQDYWLYVLFHCASGGLLTPVRVQDPFAKLLARSGGVLLDEHSVLLKAEMPERTS